MTVRTRRITAAVVGFGTAGLMLVAPLLLPDSRAGNVATTAQAAQQLAVAGPPALTQPQQPTFLSLVPSPYGEALGWYTEYVADQVTATVKQRKVVLHKQEVQRRQRKAAREAARRKAAREARIYRIEHTRRPSGGLVVGDSVSLGAEACLSPLGYNVDSEIGRQFSVGFQRLRVHAQRGLPQTVVVHLGTNGPFPASEFESLMDLLGTSRRVVWVTIHLPDHSRYGFRDSMNEMIRAEGAQYPNVRIADWAKASASHPEWFAGDDIHIGGSGCQGFTDVVDAAVTDPVKVQR